ncbi:MAG: hypothetical protein WC495_05870 [Patescibacteria group bacterium]|jgi:hypothetical protein
MINSEIYYPNDALHRVEQMPDGINRHDVLMGRLLIKNARKKMRQIEIKKSDSLGYDEWWVESWACPNPKCDYGSILPDDKYCGGCGKKIKWIEDKEEKKNENR